ncbi:AP-5 complex subunit mu-1-like [Ruditapes philippinarum]|uniref:AP-5 complex subunit mu-1-like n=1 Tax=Ruditapes philippinarum TaxID=129788 RepID=UPI00295B3645|nr:AP-5 complex subunit mu-1-like [Ruditapes philippinarum]
MSIQALWIVRNRPVSKTNEEDVVLFSRLYQTYIRKSKELDGDQYVKIPSNPELAKSVMFELGHTADEFSKFVQTRDSCERIEQKPVYEISTKDGKLWPMVVVEQSGLVLCCLPFVKQGTKTRPPLIDIPGVTLGFTLLCALGDFLRNTPISDFDQKISDIYAFLTQAAPFGTVLDTTVDSVLAKMTNKISATPKTQKVFIITV